MILVELHAFEDLLLHTTAVERFLQFEASTREKLLMLPREMHSSHYFRIYITFLLVNVLRGFLLGFGLLRTDVGLFLPVSLVL